MSDLGLDGISFLVGAVVGAWLFAVIMVTVLAYSDSHEGA